MTSTQSKTVETIYICLMASVGVKGKTCSIGLHLGIFFQVEPVGVTPSQPLHE